MLPLGQTRDRCPHRASDCPQRGSQSQISATISEATRERLDRFTQRYGLKKNFVVEQALLYFMEARGELPDEALVPARLLVEDKAFDRSVELVESPPAPAKACES